MKSVILVPLELRKNQYVAIYEREITLYNYNMRLLKKSLIVFVAAIPKAFGAAATRKWTFTRKLRHK
jgi:hypothetical protein